MDCLTESITGGAYDDYDDYASDYGYDYSNDYGYDMPNPGESFSDYVQRVDPDLYDSITDRYNSLS